MESFVIQAVRPRAENLRKFYGDQAVPLAFVHASDMHNVPVLWQRMVEYVNYYNPYLAFILHTGDYCGGSQKLYTDMYLEADCLRPIYHCPGNHDCEPGNGGWTLAPKESVHKLLYNHTENWDVTFMDCQHSMSYYKDFPKNNLRLIVLDQYYDIWPTRRWLAAVLDEALAQNFHVITAMHEPTGYIQNTYGVKFHTLDSRRELNEAYELARTDYDFDHRGRVLYEDVILDFIKKGGCFVCNLAGHEHTDLFGLSEKGRLP